MKRIFTFFVVALVGVGSIRACMRKPQNLATDTMKVFVGYVQDTTQALLPNAEVTVGSQSVKTSWDGRFVFEGLPSGPKLTIRCEGYKPQKIELKDIDRTKPLVVALVPEAQKNKHKEDGGVYYTLGRGKSLRGGDAYYKTMATSATVESSADVMVDAVYEEAAELPHVLPYPSAANDVSAGKLTAGEVNDFAKWQLWPSIIDKTHKQFLNEWRLEARERYTVQVVNKRGYPIVNYPITLTDEHGNTVYQAMTDNTGKAELWNGLVMLNSERVTINEPRWKTIVVDEECDHTDEVDVLFVFDATGSMGDELRYLQAEMKDVIARASQATGGLTIRTGAVVYRDHGDEYLTRISRLTEDIKTTQSFIDKQEANGGGDYPEAIPEALMAALNSAGWNENARARIAFLILDAPCHQDSTTIALLHEQVLNAAAQGVRIVPVVCSGIGESGELLMRSIALATNGTSFFLTDDSGIGLPHLKPTTDSLKVEHLNDMLVRTIVEFSTMLQCSNDSLDEQIVHDQIVNNFVPNPFDAKDLENDPSIPHGEGVHYLVDVSGKLITIYEGSIEDFELSILSVRLPYGVYFIKTYIDGQWYTKKILLTP